MIHWYEEYLVELHRLVEGWDIIGVGYPGHSIDHKGPEAPFNMDQLIEHLEHTVDFVGRLFPNIPHYLSGHSLGSYLSVKILEKRNYLEKLVLLFPTIESIGASPLGRLVTVVSQPGLRHLVLWMHQLLVYPFPLVWICLIIRLMTGQSGKTLEATARLIKHPSIAKHALTLAHDEMSFIGPLEQVHDTIHKHQSKIYAYYGANDGFVPRTHYLRSIQNYPQSRLY